MSETTTYDVEKNELVTTSTVETRRSLTKLFEAKKGYEAKIKANQDELAKVLAEIDKAKELGFRE